MILVFLWKVVLPSWDRHIQRYKMVSFLWAADNQHFNVFLKVTNLLLTAPRSNIEQTHWECS